MSWGAVDDRFPTHSKRLRLARSEHHDTAVALWTLGLAWCCGQTSERFSGFVPDHVPWSFGLRGDIAASIDALVVVGLWDTVDDPCGWTFHDWSEWNGIGGKELRSKEAARLRQRAHRLRQCQAGNHSKECPTEDIEGAPWACPKRARNSASRDTGSGRVGTGRDGQGSSTEEPPSWGDVPEHLRTPDNIVQMPRSS